MNEEVRHERGVEVRHDRDDDDRHDANAAPYVSSVTYVVIGSIGDNSPVNLGQGAVQQVGATNEGLLRTLEWVLNKLHEVPADELSTVELRAQVEALLVETGNTMPDKTVLARGLDVVRRILTPITAGTSKAVSAQTAQLVGDIFGRLEPFMRDFLGRGEPLS